MISTIILGLAFVGVLLLWVYTDHQNGERHEAEREAWRIERQQLLDRIQAPTFGEYKQAEVKVIKAQNAEKEPPPLEQL